MKQSVLTSILNIGSIALTLLVGIMFVLIMVFSNQVSKANSDRYDLTANAKRFMDGSAYLTSEVRSFAATANIIHFDNYWNEINTLKNRDIGVANIKNIGITTAEQAKVDEMASLSNNLVPLESKAMELVQAGRLEEAREAVFGSDYEATIAKIRNTQQEFITALDSRAKGHVNDLQNKVMVLQIMTAFILLVIIIFQVITQIVIKKKVIKPIIAVKDVMLDVSRGNLSTSFNLEADTSEIGMLVGAIKETKKTISTYISHIDYALGEFANNNFVLKPPTIAFVGDFQPIETSFISLAKEMSETLSQIRMAANQVAEGSEQVSFGAQSLSQGATEQASSIEELSASINEISLQLKKNAENSSTANRMANDAASAIQSSNEQMQKLMVSMDKINTKSTEISKIIKTIEDIAFQTNILALNAAVEAARAGAAGKGFAVVADEVRNLAGKSADAAKNTTALIEDSVKSIIEGVKLTNDTANDLLGAVENVMNTKELIFEITRSTGEQANSISQVTIGVEQISSVVQTNSATSEESAAASEELSSQANLMKDLVGRFKIQE